MADVPERRRDVPIISMPTRVRKADERQPGIPQSSSTFKDSWAKRRDIRIDGEAQLQGSFAKAVFDVMQESASPSTRLVKAFRDAEGRDPSPDGDPRFWEALAQLQGVESDDRSTPVRKTADEEFLTKLRKALKGDAPGWLRAIAEKEE